MARAAGETARLDDAARAGWLYYVAGNTQDEIARKLGVSRQSAQRLVSLAVQEKLVKFRLDHPIARCMDLAAALTERFDLQFCDVVPTDPAAPELATGVAAAGAAEMERWLADPEPRVIGLGTGRMLRACVEQLPRMDCPQHHLVSLVGNMSPDGSATAYNVVVRLAEKVGAPHNPMPLIAVVRCADDLKLMHAQEPVENTLALAARADVTFVGIGHIDETSPLAVDGFISPEESAELIAQGAVGEMVAWAFDAEGRQIAGLTNARVSSAPLDPGTDRRVCGLALGRAKQRAILGALRGRLINALITDEATAEAVLALA
ncbi:sugar-binding transcriptional regulator [Vannielia litorea]|uniref:sugar-binding transcriptional regulator n=1 Tax=Vannielia litorea TaxID=1217970 RepID=UPI001BCE3EA0|nr:sugar-binding transcriptional regulator [Vannielia litorea]MBS8228937.1 sugar-binding transcriptional regulator [Vannielia litorea]